MTEQTKHRLQFRRASITRKQMVVIMLTSCMSLLLACGGFVAYEVITFRATVVENLSTLSDIVANNSTAAVQYGVQKSAADTLAMLRSEHSIEAALILNSSGKIFAEYQRHPQTPRIRPTLALGDYQFTRDELTLQRPIRLEGEVIGSVCLLSNLRALYSRLWQYASVASSLLLASALSGFLLSAR